MSNTIELLESIGRDASLRHASGENLVQALNGMGANAGLKMAAASGDRSHLAHELGNKSNVVNHNPPNGGCDPGDDDMGNEPDQDVDEDGDGKDGSHAADREH